MDYNAIISQLSKQPSVEQLALLLTDINKQDSEIPRPLKLKLITVILSHTIPELYSDLSNNTKRLLHKVLLDKFGLGSIISRITLLSSQTLTEIVISHLTSLLLLLSSLLMNKGVLLKSYQQSIINDSGLREFKSLFFGSRILSICSKVIVSTHTTGSFEWVGNAKQYQKFLTDELSYLILNVDKDDIIESILPQCFMSTCSLYSPNNGTIILDVFLTPNLFPKLQILFKALSQNQKTIFLRRYLILYLSEKYLSTNNNLITKRILASSIVLKELLSYKHDDGYEDDLFNIFQDVLKQTISLNNSNMELLIISTLSSLSQRLTEKLFHATLKSWSDNLSVKHTPIPFQQSETRILIYFLRYVSKAYLLKNVIHDSIFLNGISNRLSSTAPVIRTLGMIIAEEITSIANENDNKLSFDIEEQVKVFKASMAAPLDNLDSLSDWRSILDESSNSKNLFTLPVVKERNISPIASESILNADSDDSDDEFQSYAFLENDDEDSDDDPTIARKLKPKVPSYIRDLLSYLMSDDFDQVELALINGPELIRKKSNFGTEVSFYAQQLTSSIIGLEDKFDIENFNEYKLDWLKSLVYSSPKETIPHIINAFFHNDYSLQQRMIVLSGLTLGIRVLRGFSDNNNTENEYQNHEAVSEFASKLLPAHIHKRFITYNTTHKQIGMNEVNAISLSLQRQTLKDTIKDARDDDALSGPKILRVSRNLELRHQNQQKHQLEPQKRTHFLFKNVSTLIFYPMITGWWASGGALNIGKYSTVLMAHFINTLAIILHASYPSCLELRDMSGELIRIVLSLKSLSFTEEGEDGGSTEPIILDSLLTSILVILDIMDSQFIIQTWPHELIELQSWLEQIWSDIIDAKTRGVAAGALLRIHELVKSPMLLGELMSVEHSHVKIQDKLGLSR